MTPFKKQLQVETKDLYRHITDQIIEALSQSTDWVMPWHQKGLKLPQNALTQNPYSGVNILSLWLPIETGMLSSCFRKRIRANTNFLKFFYKTSQRSFLKT